MLYRSLQVIFIILESRRGWKIYWGAPEGLHKFGFDNFCLLNLYQILLLSICASLNSPDLHIVIVFHVYGTFVAASNLGTPNRRHTPTILIILLDSYLGVQLLLLIASIRILESVHATCCPICFQRVTSQAHLMLSKRGRIILCIGLLFGQGWLLLHLSSSSKLKRLVQILMPFLVYTRTDYLLVLWQSFLHCLVVTFISTTHCRLIKLSRKSNRGVLQDGICRRSTQHSPIVMMFAART